MITNLGYPRMGDHCEWKKTLEGYWASEITQAQLMHTMNELRIANWRKQSELGIELIPVGDFSLYDHVLDHSFAFGLAPQRFEQQFADPLARYFAAAQGASGVSPSQTSAWFGTNYHYVMPELNIGMEPKLIRNYWLEQAQEAASALGLPIGQFKPVIIGPFTYVTLAQVKDDEQFASYVGKLLPVYGQLLADLAAAGVTWVQIDEPAFAQELSKTELKLVEETYEALRRHAAGLKLMLQTYFGAVPQAQHLMELPVDGFGFDFVHDQGMNIAAVAASGFPEDKLLCAGIIDGRNIWRTDLSAAWRTLSILLDYVPANRLALSPSCSLLHVPVSLKHEAKQPQLARLAAAFADEKLQELATLARGIRQGRKAIALDLADSDIALHACAVSPQRNLFTEGLDDVLKQHQAFVKPSFSFSIAN
ncbi:hypothetical protein [Paenibacillus phyllosphaerae]|nr:hypothetical protein [Paenibacillus phyllosphaerae]